MSVFYGTFLLGGYFWILASTARLAADMPGTIVTAIFVCVSVGGGIVVVKLQEAMERKLILRHTQKNPLSNWSYLAKNVKAKRSKFPIASAEILAIS